MTNSNNVNSMDYTNKSSFINSFTRENLSGYLKYLPLENKKILTINSSGDDMLNSIFFGANDLTLCNPIIFSNYYLYLKIAGLISLNYNDFCNFFFKHGQNMHLNNKMFSKKLFKKISHVLKDINEESFVFFDTLFENNDPRKVRENYFIDSNYHNKVIKNFNIYLRNEDAYNKLKAVISNVKISYINKNIIDTNLDTKYDSILLSNLCMQMTLKKYIDLLKRLNNNLNENGIIMLAYLWNINIYTPDYANVWKNIYDNPESNRFMKKYITDIYEISGYLNNLWENNEKDDKVLVYRKKN